MIERPNVVERERINKFVSRHHDLHGASFAEKVEVTTCGVVWHVKVWCRICGQKEVVTDESTW